MFSGSKLGSPVTSGVTRRESRVYFVDCKGILTPVLRAWVQKSTLLLQNRGHAEVLKKTPSSAKYVTRVRPPSVPECPPPPPPGGHVSLSNLTPSYLYTNFQVNSLAFDTHNACLKVSSFDEIQHGKRAKNVCCMSAGLCEDRRYVLSGAPN